MPKPPIDPDNANDAEPKKPDSLALIMEFSGSFEPVCPECDEDSIENLHLLQEPAPVFSPNITFPSIKYEMIPIICHTCNNEFQSRYRYPIIDDHY